MKWNEHLIARHLVHSTFERALAVCDRCYWTGSECDLLVVHKSLRLIDVEIKISREDFRADASKDKWWGDAPWKVRRLGLREGVPGWARGYLWPRHVWKHYYAIPEEIWDESLLETCSPVSGVLLLRGDHYGRIVHRVRRAAKPRKDARVISAAQALDIARLASLRAWDAYAALATAGMGRPGSRKSPPR